MSIRVDCVTAKFAILCLMSLLNKKCLSKHWYCNHLEVWRAFGYRREHQHVQHRGGDAGFGRHLQARSAQPMEMFIVVGTTRWSHHAVSNHTAF